MIVPAIGSLTGGGTISPKQELNFKMAAKLVSAASSTGALGTLSRLTGGQQGGGIPFRIQGTTSNPVFVPDVGGIVGGLTGQPATGGKVALPGGKDLGEALGGMFGRQKQ
jgi:AsmA protein